MDADNDRRRQIAQRYLSETKNKKIQLPFYDGTKNHVFHVFAVRVETRDDFTKHLNENDIGYLIHYPIPPHQQKALSNYRFGTFPITERIHQNVVSIPISPVMTDVEVTQVINVLNNY